MPPKKAENQINQKLVSALRRAHVLFENSFGMMERILEKLEDYGRVNGNLDALYDEGLVAEFLSGILSEFLVNNDGTPLDEEVKKAVAGHLATAMFLNPFLTYEKSNHAVPDALQYAMVTGFFDALISRLGKDHEITQCYNSQNILEELSAALNDTQTNIIFGGDSTVGHTIDRLKKILSYFHRDALDFEIGVTFEQRLRLSLAYSFSDLDSVFRAVDCGDQSGKSRARTNGDPLVMAATKAREDVNAGSSVAFALAYINGAAVTAEVQAYKDDWLKKESALRVMYAKRAFYTLVGSKIHSITDNLEWIGKDGEHLQNVLQEFDRETLVKFGLLLSNQSFRDSNAQHILSSGDSLKNFLSWLRFFTRDQISEDWQCVGSPPDENVHESVLGALKGAFNQYYNRLLGDDGAQAALCEETKGQLETDKAKIDGATDLCVVETTLGYYGLDYSRLLEHSHNSVTVVGREVTSAYNELAQLKAFFAASVEKTIEHIRLDPDFQLKEQYIDVLNRDAASVRNSMNRREVNDTLRRYGLEKEAIQVIFGEKNSNDGRFVENASQSIMLPLLRQEARDEQNIFRDRENLVHHYGKRGVALATLVCGASMSFISSPSALAMVGASAAISGKIGAGIGGAIGGALGFGVGAVPGVVLGAIVGCVAGAFIGALAYGLALLMHKCLHPNPNPKFKAAVGGVNPLLNVGGVGASDILKRTNSTESLDGKDSESDDGFDYSG